MDLVWRFRFFLTRDPKGLTKFLKSVTWSDAAEAAQATEVILPKWQNPAIDDALELLGPGFKDRRVRAYAVGLLEKADDSELILYLLQLVQAIKFDSLAQLSSSVREERDSKQSSTEDEIAAAISSPSKPVRPSRSMRASSSINIFGEHQLADFLIRRGIRNAELGNNLYWYIYVECEDKVQGKLFASVKEKFLDRLADMPSGRARRDEDTIEMGHRAAVLERNTTSEN